MAGFDDSWSSNPWRHPDDPYPLTIPLRIPLSQPSTAPLSRAEVAELAENLSPMSECSERADAAHVDEDHPDDHHSPPTEAAGSDNLAESAIQEATVQQQQPEQQQLLEHSIDMINGDSQMPGPPDCRFPEYWKRLAELAEGLSPLSEISEEPDDEFMEDPVSPRATSVASTTSLTPHIEGDIDWDVPMAAETGICTGERGPRIPDEQTPLLTGSSSSHSTLLRVFDSEHTDNATVDSEPTIRPTAKRSGYRGGRNRDYHAWFWNRPTPPRGPPPARRAHAQADTTGDSLGRQSKARPIERPR